MKGQIWPTWPRPLKQGVAKAPEAGEISTELNKNGHFFALGGERTFFFVGCIPQTSDMPRACVTGTPGAHD